MRQMISIVALCLIAVGVTFTLCQDRCTPSVELSTMQFAMTNTVFIEIYRDGNFQGCGSGCVISDSGLILTAKHVVEAGDSFIVYFNGADAGYDSEVFYIYEDRDMAVLNSCVFSPTYFSMVDVPEVGTEIFSLGAPFGKDYFVYVSKGIISRQISKHRFFGPSFMIDSSINSGMSGGPIIDENGSLIGINIGADQRGPGMCFGVPVNYEG